MIPLIIGALFLFGMAASKAKAKPAAELPVPVETPKPKLSVKTPSKKRREKKRRIIKKIEKAKTIKKVTAIAKTPKAREALNNLLRVASTSTVPKKIREKAKQRIAEVIAMPQTAKAKSVKNLPEPAKIQIASAIAKADRETKPTPDQAAKILSIWTKGGGNQGTKNNRSETVKRCQILMGFKGKQADGIIGPKTRTRALALGYRLAPRSAQKPGAVGGYDSILGF
jgi:hypothetical protein